MAYQYMIGQRLINAIQALLPKFIGREQQNLIGLAEEAAGAGYDAAFNHIAPLESFKTTLQGTGGAGAVGSIGPSNVQTDIDGLKALTTTVPRVTTYNSSAAGKVAAIAANVTILAAATGTTFTIYNDSAASITLTPDTGLTMRLAGTANTGARTLAARGICSIWFNSSSEAIANGAGLT